MLSQFKFNKIARISIALISITIPFWMVFNNIAIIFATVISIVNLVLFNKEQRRWVSIFNGYIFLFVLMTVSLFYTENLKLGFIRLEQRSFFVLMPFISFSLSNIIDKKMIYMVMKYFVWAVIIASLIFVINATINTFHYASLNPFNEINGNFFSYIKFTQIIEDTHPIYFGTYVLFSIFVIGNDYFEDDQIFTIRKSIRLFLVLYLIIISLLLNSFLLTGLLFLLLFYFFYKLLKDDKLSRISKFCLICFVISITVVSSSFVINKFKGVALKEDILSRDFSGDKFTAVKARTAKIYSSVDLISENFWFGVGVGDEIDELMKYYEKNNFSYGVKRRFNSHNQYLTESISTGILGMLGLLACFFIIFRRGVNSENNYLLLIGLIYFCFCLTESALVRNKGIVFFLFFTCILFPINKKGNIKTKIFI